MTTSTIRTDDFSSYIDQVSLELFTVEDWDSAKGYDSLLGSTDFNDMVGQVMTTAFERKPELFEGIQWINTDWGFPLWVRPGVTWEMPDEDDDDDFYSEEMPY